MLQLDGRPLGLTWNYDRTELLTDGIIHAIGLGLALIGVVVLVVVSCYSTQGLETASIVIYAVGLLAMLGCSAAYNLWPISPRKWSLRRFDHSAIYLFIAATYTPLIAQMKSETTTYGLLLGVWSVAVLGIVLKLALPGRFDRISIGLYMLLGWSGVMAYEPVVATLPSTALWLLAAGGLLYSAGVVFHLWASLRFQNTIWHGFVLVAALCHYTAILDCVALARM
jgi:hemolysin III